MKLGRILFLGAAFVLCGASSALAGPKYLVSAPALRSTGSTTLYCDIVNLDVAPQDVTIDIMDYAGGVVTSFGPWTIPPQNGIYHNDSFGTGAWCRFTVNTSTKKFRAMAIYDDGLTYVATIPAY